LAIFANTLPLRIDSFGKSLFSRNCSAALRICPLEAYAHQEAPFDKLVEALAPSEVWRHSPLFR